MKDVKACCLKFSRCEHSHSSPQLSASLAQFSHLLCFPICSVQKGKQLSCQMFHIFPRSPFLGSLEGIIWAIFFLLNLFLFFYKGHSPGKRP